MPTPDRRQACDGTDEWFRLAVGVMSRPGNFEQRVGVRDAWLRSSSQLIGCFVVGQMLKATPRAPWDKKPKKRPRERRAARLGELVELPTRSVLLAEHARYGDVLMLNDTAEIGPAHEMEKWAQAARGTSGLKTVPWWRHATRQLPNAEWIAKADDDTFINLPALLARLPPLASAHDAALLGTIKWGCYSAARLKFERSCPFCTCGRSDFARSRAPGEPANLSSTYEGPYQFALGWFYAIPRTLARLLAGCEAAGALHSRAMAARSEPFLRKEDDPLNGYWIYKCLRERAAAAASADLPTRVEPLPSLAEGHQAHNMACISRRGLYRVPTNKSVIIHFLKTPRAMRYVRELISAGGADGGAKLGEPEGGKCLSTLCSNMVWPDRPRLFPRACMADAQSPFAAFAASIAPPESRRVEPLAPDGGGKVPVVAASSAAEESRRADSRRARTANRGGRRRRRGPRESQHSESGSQAP